MFKNFSKLFSSKNGPKQDVCQIIFSLSVDGYIKTQLLWPDLQYLKTKSVDTISIELATILFGLMNGHFKQDIYEALDNGKQTGNANDIIFIEKIYENFKTLEYMKNKAFKEIDRDNPIVGPTEVFKKS